MARIGSAARRHTANPGAKIESLETRQLLSVAVAATIPDVLANTATPSSNTVSLGSYLADANVPGTIANFTFYASQPIFAGKSHTAVVQVALTDGATPITVANFLNYADSGAYNDTFLHRAVDIASGSGGSATDNATIEQGGGYYVNSANPYAPKISQIKTNAAIVNEAATETFGNVAGTIAMARTTDVNSATSQWFFNVSDNTDLDESTSNSDSSDTTGYAVFGKVLGDGLTTLTTLSKLPTATISSSLGLTTVPVVGVAATAAKTTKAPIRATDLVFVKSVTSQSGVTYTATSSDPGLVSPVVDGNKLAFRYGSTSGTATITVTAQDGYDGSSASETFHVTVPASTTTGTTPVTVADTVSTGAGTAVTFDPLANDTDAAAALTGSSLAITTQPTSGAATVDTATGTITYTPLAGFTGTDTLDYTVRDAAGNTSAATAVTFDVIAAPPTVTLGTASVRVLQLTAPGGKVSRVSVAGGTALVTFTGSGVTTTTAHGTVIASGADATIASIAVTDASKKDATLTVSGGASTIGSITSSGAMHAIVAPAATLTAALNITGTLGLLRLASATAATLDIGGSSTDQTTVDLPTATNTALYSTSGIALLRSTSWTNTDGGAYLVSAPSVGNLSIRNAFADGLAINGGALKTATVGGVAGGTAAGTWNITGTVGTATIGSAGTDWAVTTTGAMGSLNVRSGGLADAVTAGGIQSLTVKGDVSGAVTSTAAIGKLTVTGNDSGGITGAGAVTTLDVRGNLTSNVTAASVGTLAVTGSLTGSTVTTNSTSTKTTQLKRLQVGGAISTSTINAAGSIGTVSAGSISASSLFAGILDTTVTAGTLPSASTDFNVAATLRSLRLTGHGTTFSNSKIAAETIRRLSLGTVQNSNGGTSEGVAAETLDALTAKLAAGGTLDLHRPELKTASALSSYISKKKITLDDFAVHIVAASSSSS